jgi:peptide/nickel transport system ATP-binding protein
MMHSQSAVAVAYPTVVNSESVLDVAALTVRVDTPGGGSFNAVDAVSLRIQAGEILGVVGESGSGKSMLAKAVMGLLPAVAKVVRGSVRLEATDLLSLDARALRKILGREMSMVFQDPMTSMNPVIRVGDQLAEAIRLHRPTKPAAAMAQARDLLARVGIEMPGRKLRNYPHEFSGGMRQRAMIAMAIANTPSLLIADEPTTALDVTVQQQILRLILDLSRASSTAVMFITHNMGVVASICQRVAVMYSGRIVEQGPVEQLFSDPQHPYTWSLLHSVPRLDREKGERLIAIPGQSPDPTAPPSGCRFHPRCPYAIPRCKMDEPPLERVGEGHEVRCWVKMNGVEAQNVHL